MNVNSKLADLRRVMKQKNLDAVIIPSSDPHQSEYVASHWQERSWISGFTGSSGTVVVTLDHAGLWTDSRYFIQAEMELSGSDFTLHKMYNQFLTPYVDYLSEVLAPNSNVAINGLMFSKSSVDGIKKKLHEHKINLVYREDLISEVWYDRPSLSLEAIQVHKVEFAGKSVKQKLAEIRFKMDTLQVDYHFISALDDLAWTFNIRGNDVDYNPVIIGYGIIGQKQAYLFVNNAKVSPNAKAYFQENEVEVKDYESLIGFLSQIDENQRMLVDHQICSQSAYESINAQIIHGPSIPKLLKSIKNEVEISHVREVMKKDGAAIAETFYWLEQSLSNNQGITECAFAEKLAHHRSLKNHYHGESFGAIIGYKSNGAIIHYHPMPETCKTILPEGILLADSGGQYKDGTTDITRTVTLNTPTDVQKRHYTLILKGMVALSMAKFPEGTTGGQLDTLARQFLWSEGLNYLHGTGHGVGFFLNVHESPQGFGPVHSERGKTIHQVGMLSSNEPGHYVEGQYGMRIENLIVVINSEIPGFLEFETLTLYPFDHKLLDREILNSAEIKWINDYHELVYKGISPFLNGEIKEWFIDKCKALA